MESEQGKDKGVISLAEVVETYKKSDFKENEKHSEVRWISREEVDTFKEDTVKDFKNTLKLAFAKWRRCMEIQMNDNSIVEMLETIFSNVNSWLNFAEAKNAALMAFNIAMLAVTWGVQRMLVRTYYFMV